jgi:hypothetical protein
MKKFLVTIISEKNNQTFEESFDCDNLVNVSRLMIAYKPKRGYEPIHFSVDVVETLI